MNDKFSSVLERELVKRDVTKKPAVKPKVNIKEMCKKFESLSSSDSSLSSDVVPSPIAPIRKSKNNASLKRQDRIQVVKPTLRDKDPTDFNGRTETPPKRRMSIKERSKMFEAEETNVIDSNESVFTTSQTLHTCKITPEESISSEIHLPPVKPPRIFLEAGKNIPQNNSPGSDSPINSNGEKVFNVKTDLRDNLKPRISSSSSVEFNTVHESGNTSRPPIRPEVVANRDSIKSQGFRNYLKNLSTAASNLRYKVKQSQIFVDLTPTTVSPPKHYGTLKKSRSEEHIYAEPFCNRSPGQVGKSPTKKKDEPVHYMCTTLVKPEVPERNTPIQSRLSVKSMIYDSFSQMHTTSRDTNGIKASDPSDSDVSMKAIQARIIYVKSIKQISGSSICIAPKLFEALYFINVMQNQPEVSHSFPFKIPASFKFPLLPHICFPDVELFKVVSAYQSEMFHFTFNDKGEKTFGYCLRIMGWPESSHSQNPLCVKLPIAICILSRFNAQLFYKKLLSEIEKHLTLPREKCFKYIRSLQKLGVPNAGANVSIPDFTECAEDRVVIPRPLDSHTVGVELTRILQLLDVNILVKIVASLLLERRVLLFSFSPSNLYDCCKALLSLLYPFDWPHMFLPVLPSCLIVHCCSELPYLLGLLSTNYNSVLELLAEQDLLIIDIDKGSIVKSYGDEDTILPRKIQRAVMTALNLAKNMTDPTEMLRDVMISEAFVHMFVEMIGHYENHIAEQNGSFIFQKEGLVKNAFSYSIQIFLQWFSETQIFDAFASDSLWRAQYRKLCQTNQRTVFEKRVDEYNWELSLNGGKFSCFIEKTVRNIGERIIHKLKK